MLIVIQLSLKCNILSWSFIPMMLKYVPNKIWNFDWMRKCTIRDSLRSLLSEVFNIQQMSWGGKKKKKKNIKRNKDIFVHFVEFSCILSAATWRCTPFKFTIDNENLFFLSKSKWNMIVLLKNVKPTYLVSVLAFNTLRMGLLNCLNARSRGLTCRHRASCV